MERQIRHLKISDSVVLIGFRHDLDSLIAGADIVVLPSFSEGLPNIALEAAAAGIPIVATAVGGTPEVVVDGRTGFLVPPDEPMALANRIIGLLNAPHQRLEFGAVARRRMLEEFSFDAQSEAYRTLVEELVSSPRLEAACR